MQEQHQAIAEIAARYRAARKKVKCRILNQLTALIGYNCKYILHLLIQSDQRHYSASLTANHYKTKIHVRTFQAGDEQRPGYLEIDTALHRGPSLEHEFCCTLNATNRMTGFSRAQNSAQPCSALGQRGARRDP